MPTLDSSSDQSEIISPTGDPNGRVGELEASFLSSKNKFTFSESSMSSITFSVSYVSTAQNFDIFKWIFEGGYVSNSGSNTTSSGTTVVEGNINDPNTSSQIGVLVEYREGFGRYDVTHAVANSASFDVNTKSDYVTYVYLDNLKVKNSSNPNGWLNTSGLWFSPSDNSTATFSVCENSIVGFYDNDDFTLVDPIDISKEFSNFGNSKKNLVFSINQIDDLNSYLKSMNIDLVVVLYPWAYELYDNNLAEIYETFITKNWQLFFILDRLSIKNNKSLLKENLFI